ncbi:peptidoglycan DD-metalloendopeptidase family protein, partial [Oscillatoriales cyanobacterium LEGE 11467]
FKRSKQFAQTAPQIDRPPTPSAKLSQSALKPSISTADVDPGRGLDTDRLSMASSIDSSQPSTSLSVDAEKPTGLSGKTISTLGASAVHPNVRSRLNAAVHRVRDGESIYKIARQYNISVEELANLNGLSDPSFIRVGQQIDIPPGATLTPQTSLTVFGNKVASKSSENEESVPRVSLPRHRSISTSIELDPIDSSTSGKVNGVPNLGVARSQKAIDRTQAESSSWVAFGQGSDDTNQRLAAKLKTGSPNQASASADTREYVEELRAGIDKLRAKHRVRPESETVAAATEESISSARQINPEFAPEQHTAALQTEGLQPWSQSHTEVEAAEVVEEEFVLSATLPEETIEESTASLDSTASQEDSEVAVAPLGSRNYAPIGAPRMVSPELPSLSAPQAYLPKVAPGTLSPGSGDFSGSYTWPAQGELSSGYGWRWGRMHQGIDIAGPVGTPIVAAASGVVSYSRWNSGGYGNLVEITHPDGSITLYAHNSRLLVNEGEEVAQGQQIAEMGSTGYSTGPHVHFELHPAGVGAVDPIAYLQ